MHGTRYGNPVGCVVATQRGGRACLAAGRRRLAGRDRPSLFRLGEVEHSKCGDSCEPPLIPEGGEFVRREDLLKPDVMSEVILLGFGALIFAILLLILVAAWTQAPRLV